MIAQVKPNAPSIPAWHGRFLALLPAVLRQARIAFRSLDPERHEDALAGVRMSRLMQGWIFDRDN